MDDDGDIIKCPKCGEEAQDGVEPLVCNECGEMFYTGRDFEYDKDDEVHKYWYAFCEHFGKKYGMTFGGAPEVKNMIGYECMQELDKYVKKHPEIVLVGTEDSFFASSYFVLIPHPEFGITIIFVPQSTTVQGEAFMYPKHSEELILEIEKMKKKYNI